MDDKCSIEDLENMAQDNSRDVQKFCQLYSYLSQTEEMSQKQNEQEAIRMVNQTTGNIL